MKDVLGKFRIIEPIDPGGYTMVYRGIEEMGAGVTRPAAVKVLQNCQVDDEEQIETLRREVEVLAEVGTSPNIVNIYGFGIDDEVGPWIAMELGRSLKHFHQDEPANPEEVRALLRDTLRGLVAVHGSDPQILHRDIKPQNILATTYGTWKLADFGLAKRDQSEETLAVMTVKYAAPEMLDSSLGPESPKMDLYSLGHVAYEYALGIELHRKQFPSIYDPHSKKGGDSGDDRPKWMYWHTSPQMTVPPLAELIADFPEDLSDLIAGMMAKPVRERIGSAQEALARIGEVRADLLGTTGTTEVVQRDSTGTLAKVLLLLLTIVVIVIMAAAAWYFFMQSTVRPVISFDGDETFQSDTPVVLVTGTIEDFPDGGAAEIRLRDGASTFVTVDDEGAFAGQIGVSRLRLSDGHLTITDRSGRQRARKNLKVERIAPERVGLELSTRPKIPNATVIITEQARPDDFLELVTDENGSANTKLAYGPFDIEVTHPRFRRQKARFETGIDPVKSVTVPMVPLSDERVEQKRDSALSEMEGLVDIVALGDSAARRRLEQLRDQIAMMGTLSSDRMPSRRATLMEEMDDVAARAAAGDPEAAARLKEINAELRSLSNDRSGPSGSGGGGGGGSGGSGGSYYGSMSSGERSERRAALMSEMADLQERAANGDPEAQARLQQIRRELQDIDRADVGSMTGAQRGARRAAIMSEMADLRERAANGDPEAIARLQGLERELQEINRADATSMTGAQRGARRTQLMAEMADLRERAANGDPEAIARLQELDRELQEINRADAASMTGAQRSTRRTALMSEMADLRERAANGDPEAAARLKVLEQELQSLDEADRGGGGSGGSASGAQRNQQRADLTRDMADLTRRAAAGDAGAAEELRQRQSQLREFDRTAEQGGVIAQRRADLMNERASLVALAAAGDPNAAARLQEIDRELGALAAIESAQGDPGLLAAMAGETIGGIPALDLIDRTTLMRLPDEAFLAFIEVNLPTGALSVVSVPHVSRLRVRGPVFDEAELERVAMRLAPAEPRLLMEVRVDPWAVCRKLEEKLVMRGATDVRVHAHLATDDHVLFVQYRADGTIAHDAVVALARSYVVDPDLVFVQGM